jgi:hypothetical protein
VVERADRQRRTVIATLLIFALALSACGGDDDDATTAATVATVPKTTTTTVRATQAVSVDGWTSVTRRANGSDADVQWFQGPNDQLVAVALPVAKPPFPVVVFYHGGSGLFPQSVTWTTKLADAGFAVVTGCWSPGASDTVQCPKVTNPEAGVGGIFDFATKLPGGDPKRFAVVGISSCAAPAALTTDVRVHALVTDSGHVATVHRPGRADPRAHECKGSRRRQYAGVGATCSRRG